MRKVFMLDPTNCYILLALSHDGAILFVHFQQCIMANFREINPATGKVWKLAELYAEYKQLKLDQDSLTIQDYGKIFKMVTTDLKRRAALHTKEMSDLARDWKTQYSPWLAENLQPVLVSSKSRFDSVRKNIKPNLFLN